MRPRGPTPLLSTTLLAFALTTACRSSEASGTPEVHIAPPPPNATKAEHLPGVHNVVSYAPNLICGGVPEGEEGLRTLAAMGVKTIITVDGAAPDVEGAKQLGMRYVHLPISYDTVTPERQKQLAQAVCCVEGPIYMHCHHGKHRSAAALGSAMVLAGKMTSEQAQERMGVSGTAKEYTGLWQAVKNAKPLPADQLVVDPKTLPSITKVTGMVATMSEIDSVIDLVKQAKEAGWKAPKDHPDVVATNETARLAALFASLQKDPESAKRPADYQTKLANAIQLGDALDRALRANDAANADKQLAALNKSCKECHATYRDK